MDDLGETRSQGQSLKETNDDGSTRRELEPTKPPEEGGNLSASIVELEKRRNMILQKLEAAPNIDSQTHKELLDVGTGLRYGRYAHTHKPKAKAKSKGKLSTFFI